MGVESEREPTGRTSDGTADEQYWQEDEPLDDAQADLGGNTALPPKIEAWRRRSAAGAILTGFALGLQEALETRKDEPSIVMETSGEPPKDLPVEADFEYGRPRQSVVQIRPWLLPDNDAEIESPAGYEAGEAAGTDGVVEAGAGQSDEPHRNPGPPEPAGGH